MDEIAFLSERQMARLVPYFPRSHGIAWVDDRRILSGILFVIRNGLRWRDAPPSYDPHKTIYNRFVRWSRLGVFDRIFAELARGGEDGVLMIDATHLCAVLAPAIAGHLPRGRVQASAQVRLRIHYHLREAVSLPT